MSSERAAAVTLQGNPFTLVGPELQVGAKAPDFLCVGKDMKPASRADLKGKVRVISVVPSLDTPVCDAQSRRFDNEASSLADVHFYSVSMDLPFAQSRWCASAETEHLTMLSDHREASFGRAFGTLIKELRLLSRAIFVLDEDNVIRYVEYVSEVGEHPDYGAALKAISELS